MNRTFTWSGAKTLKKPSGSTTITTGTRGSRGGGESWERSTTARAFFIPAGPRFLVLPVAIPQPRPTRGLVVHPRM